MLFRSPIARRGLTQYPGEDRVHVLDGLESRSLRNLGRRKVAVAQQLLRRGDTVREDFGVQRRTEFDLEPVLERGPRYADELRHLFVLDALAGVLPNVVAGLHHMRAERTHMLAGRLGIQSGRPDDQRPESRARAAQHLMKQVCGRVSHLVSALTHRGQADANQ